MPRLRSLASFASLACGALPALALAACTDPPANATLADLPSPHVSVQLWAARDFGPTPGFVSISYDTQRFRAEHGDDCATIGSFDASLTGATLSHVGHGSNDDEFDDCYFPSFEFAAQFAADKPTTLVVGDDSLTITAELAGDAFAPHVPTLASATDWTFAPGETVTVNWPQPTDLAERPSYPYIVSFNNNGDGDDFDLNPTFTTDQIQFTIPNPPPSTGDGIVGFLFGYTVGNAVTCTGATTCTFSAERGYEHTAAIRN